jgi:superfamily II DNA or RNA helicase
VNAPLFPPAVAEPRALRLYQQTALGLLRESLGTGHRRPILQLPTGAGKTRIAAEIVNGALAKERRPIFVIPRQVLIEQTVTAFEREGIWNIGVIQGQNFRTNPNAPVQIAMAQTLARREIPPADVVIVDECHLQFKSITDWIAEPEWQAVPFIGLTATPWAKGLGKSYDDLLMPVSIKELIEEGYLSPFRVFAPPAPDLTAVRTVAGDFHEAVLSDACDTKEIIADIVKTWFEKGESRPTLCYAVDRKHAQHLQERFIEAGIRAEYIDCDVKMYDREEIFERFKAGETKIISNVATCDTGLDLPNIGCIIDARPTRSRIRFVQTIGRGLRPGEGKDHLIVLDHAASRPRHRHRDRRTRRRRKWPSL